MRPNYTMSTFSILLPSATMAIIVSCTKEGHSSEQGNNGGQIVLDKGLPCRHCWIIVTPIYLSPEMSWEKTFHHRHKTLAVFSAREMERDFVAVPFPVSIFGTTPRDIVIAGFLAELTQRSQTIDYSQIITENSDAEFVVCVCCHRTHLVHLQHNRSTIFRWPKPSPFGLAYYTTTVATAQGDTLLQRMVNNKRECCSPRVTKK